MKILPRSAFGQTILLIGFLLLINQVVSLVSIMVYIVQPQSDQVDQLLAKQVRVVFLDVKDPILTPAMAKAFHLETGIGIYTEADATKIYMGLKTWKQAPEGKILISDVTIAKNLHLLDLVFNLPK